MTDQPYFVEGATRPGRWLITCDHASNHVPIAVNNGDLGLANDQMARHIAWDIGAAGVARALASLLDSPVICSNFSRLVIDPNRGENDPTLVRKIYDGAVIPSNRAADAAEIARRRQLFFDPYHAEIARLANRREDTVYLAIHSFTPQLMGRPLRPWHVGVLFAHDTRLSDPLLERLRRDPDLCVGANQPYSGHLPGDAVDQHALRFGRLNALIELRQDLIDTAQNQLEWAARLAPHLDAALGDTKL